MANRVMRFTLALALIAMLTNATSVPAAATVAIWTPLITLGVGVGAGEVAYQNVDGDIVHGPQALTVGPDGRIYVLDSVNRRIHAIRNGAVERTYDIPGAFYPRELAIVAGRMVVLDDDNQVRILGADGSVINTVRLPNGLPAARVLRLADSGGRAMLWTGTNVEYDSQAAPSQVNLDDAKGQTRTGLPGPDARRWILTGSPSGVEVTTTDGRSRAKLNAQSYFGDARLVAFEPDGSPIIVFEDVSTLQSTVVVEQTVRRIDPSGNLTGVARIPFERFAMNPRRSVDAGPDGAIYAMVPATSGLTIYKVTLGSTFVSRLPSGSSAQLALRSSGGHFGAPLQTDSLRSRKVTADRASTMVNSNWIWHNQYNFHSNGAGRNTTIPIQLSGLADGTPVTGIPYDWGGYDSTGFADGPGSHSDGSSWTQWDGGTGAININYPSNGPLIGNTDLSASYVGDTAGIDCSGFIYAAAGYIDNPKKGTYSLMTGGSQPGIAISYAGDIQPMNYFVTPAHSFFYEYRQFSDASGFNTIEATVAGNPQGAKRYFRTWGDAGGYQQHSFWGYTTGDSYAQPYTSPGFGSACFYVRGQNVWYHFYSSTAAPVTLTGISGGDPDIWVIQDDGSVPPTGATVGSSTNGGTTNEQVNLPGAGWYYAFVHVNSTTGNCVLWTINW